MSIDDAIRQHGFRRWYERQLIISHGFLFSGLVGLIAVLLAIEMIDSRGSLSGYLALLGVAAAGGLACICAFRQFTRLLLHAEHFAGQASCPQCHTFGRFRLLSAIDAPDAVNGRALTLRCRVCASEWTIG
jgi:hypothetical protein